MKPMAPGSLSHIFAFAINFSFAFTCRSIKLKIQNTSLCFILIYFIWRSIYQSTTIYLTSVCPSWSAATRKGLTTLFTRRVVSSCYLCAGDVYAVLLGSPTSSITLVSLMREIPTTVVLHHPFLFGEIPT